MCLSSNLYSQHVYIYPVVLFRNKVGGGPTKMSGSDIGRPQGSTMAQSDISLAFETKVAGSLLESRWVSASNKTTDSDNDNQLFFDVDMNILLNERIVLIFNKGMYKYGMSYCHVFLCKILD